MRRLGWISIENTGLLPPEGKCVMIDGGAAFQIDGVWYTLMEPYKNDDYRVIQWEVKYWLNAEPHP